MKKIALVLFILGVCGEASFADYVPTTYAKLDSIECTLQVCDDESAVQLLFQLPCCNQDKYLCSVCLYGTIDSFVENLKNHKKGYFFALRECKKEIIKSLKLTDKSAIKAMVLRSFIQCPFCRGYVFTRSLKKMLKKDREKHLKHCLRRVIWR